MDDLIIHPRQTQLPNTQTSTIEWGVLFVHEDVVSNYGTGPIARQAALKTVKDWKDTKYPARLVSRTISPWTKSL